MSADLSRFIEAAAARSFDPSAEAGNYWAKVCAAAAAAEPFREGAPLEIEVDAEWAFKEGNRQRLSLALALLGLFHRDPDTLANLAEQAKISRRDGTPLDHAFLATVLLAGDNFLTGDKSHIPAKADVWEEIERVAQGILPGSKKGRWAWLKRHALDWLPQRRPRFLVGFPKSDARRKP